MVKGKIIEERMEQSKKRTNRDRLIQALKDNDLVFMCNALDCGCCAYDADIFDCASTAGCREGMERWLDQEVSDE